MKKKLIKLFVVLFLIFLSVSVCAVNNQEIVKNTISAYEEQWEGIKDITIVTDNTVSYQKRIENSKRWKMYQETEVNGMKFRSIYDGEFLWQDNPMTGQMDKTQVDFNPHDPFYELLQGNNLQYVETEKISDRKYYVFRINEEVAQEIFNFKSQQDMGDIAASGMIWVNNDNYYLKKMELEVSTGSYSFKQIINNEDFHKIKNMWIPYKTIITMGNTKNVIQVKDVKINQNISDDLFTGSK